MDLVLLWTWFSCGPGSLVDLVLLLTWFSCKPGSSDLVRNLASVQIKLFNHSFLGGRSYAHAGEREDGNPVCPSPTDIHSCHIGHNQYDLR